MKTLISISFLFLFGLVMGQNSSTTNLAMGSGQGFNINILLLSLIVILMVVITFLAKAFIKAAKRKLEVRAKSISPKVFLPAALLFLSNLVHAQNGTAFNAIINENISSQMTTIVLLCAIGLEMLIMTFLAFRVFDLMRSAKQKTAADS